MSAKPSGCGGKRAERSQPDSVMISGDNRFFLCPVHLSNQLCNTLGKKGWRGGGRDGQKEKSPVRTTDLDTSAFVSPGFCLVEVISTNPLVGQLNSGHSQ